MPEAGAPLSEATIDSIVKQFKRDRSRYEDMVEYVRKDLERALVNDLGSDVKFQLHWRVKLPGSLKVKLMKKGTHGNAPAYALASGSGALGLPQLLDRIPDLAAVRVLTYTDKDLLRVIKVLEDVWSSESESSPLEWPSEDAPERKDGDYYQAWHVCVRAKLGVDPSPLAHLEGIKCEVQVTTTADHLLNEVAHDLLYKPTYEGEDAAREITEQIIRAKELLMQTKEILTKAVAKAAAATTTEATAVDAPDRTAENSRTWLLEAPWPAGSYKPSRIDSRATRGKLDTIPYLVGLGMNADEHPDAYLDSLPSEVKKVFEEDQGSLIRRTFDSYFRAARKKGWGKVKANNPRHLSEKSRIDQTILALLLKLEADGTLSDLPSRSSGRPTVAMDIVTCFRSRGEVTGIDSPSAVDDLGLDTGQA